MEKTTVLKGTPFFEHGRCTALNVHFFMEPAKRAGVRGGGEG
jgi:hypothetical protein